MSRWLGQEEGVLPNRESSKCRGLEAATRGSTSQGGLHSPGKEAEGWGLGDGGCRKVPLLVPVVCPRAKPGLGLVPPYLLETLGPSQSPCPLRGDAAAEG